MIGATKVCPRCAERVKAAAQVCRYCGHEFGRVSLAKVDAAATGGAAASTRRTSPPRGYLWSAGAVISIVLVAVLAWAMSPKVERPVVVKGTVRETAAAAEVPVAEVLAGPQLAAGESLEWSADGALEETVRQIGTMVVRVTRKIDEDMIAPVVSVSRGTDTVTIVGEAVSSGYTHRISAVRNKAGAPPVVMLQSFSGGAHCCNHVQLAGVSGGRLKVVDLGSWDGDQIALPVDLSGDGVADFVERDDAFLYAFAAYAMSAAPPKVLNVTGGRVIDVSKRAAFRQLYLDEMATSGEICRTGAEGMDRNGACPSYVASAARVGRLDEAWAEMVRSYAADLDWELPSGCVVRTSEQCPEGSQIVYKSYPEALLAFLKEHGYVANGWSPPDAAGVDEVIPDPANAD